MSIIYLKTPHIISLIISLGVAQFTVYNSAIQAPPNHKQFVKKNHKTIRNSIESLDTLEDSEKSFGQISDV